MQEHPSGKRLTVGSLQRVVPVLRGCHVVAPCDIGGVARVQIVPHLVEFHRVFRETLAVVIPISGLSSQSQIPSVGIQPAVHLHVHISGKTVGIGNRRVFPRIDHHGVDSFQLLQLFKGISDTRLFIGIHVEAQVLTLRITVVCAVVHVRPHIHVPECVGLPLQS